MDVNIIVALIGNVCSCGHSVMTSFELLTLSIDVYLIVDVIMMSYVRFANIAT